MPKPDLAKIEGAEADPLAPADANGDGEAAPLEAKGEADEAPAAPPKGEAALAAKGEGLDEKLENVACGFFAGGAGTSGDAAESAVCSDDYQSESGSLAL